MRVEKDFVEFLGLLNKYRVKYCIIGAYAVGLYGYPRYTKDIDILVEPSRKNAKKIIQAIREFGIDSPDLGEGDFCKKHRIVQLGYEPVRIDLITSVEGANFKTIWENRKKVLYGKEKVFFVGLKELLKIKKKSSRYIDVADREKLMKRIKFK
jgi:hypothetical protein